MVGLAKLRFRLSALTKRERAAWFFKQPFVQAECVKKLVLVAHRAVVVHGVSLLFALDPVVGRHSHRLALHLGGAHLGLIAMAHDAGVVGIRDLVGVNRMRDLGGHAAGGLGGGADHHGGSCNNAGNRELAHLILLFIGVFFTLVNSDELLVRHEKFRG